jgi:hypothetical protein
VKDLAHETAFGAQVTGREVDRQVDQVGHAGGIGRSNTRQVRRHVRKDDVDGAAGEPGLEGLEHLGLAEVAGHEVDPVDRLEREQVEATIVPCSVPRGRRIRARARPNLRRRYWPMRRAPRRGRRRAGRARADAALVDLLQLARARAR